MNNSLTYNNNYNISILRYNIATKEYVDNLLISKEKLRRLKINKLLSKYNFKNNENN